DEVVFGRGDYYAELAKRCGGELVKPMLGKRILFGGFHTVYDCVGSDTTLDDSLRFTAPGGKMVLVGLAAIPKGVEWTPIWLKEITVAGALYCSTEMYEGQRMRTYEVGMRLMAEGKIRLHGMLTHTFPLADYKHALATAASKKGSNAVKVAFRF
ncbi:MAG TPA: zinc-binding dehydrogenase, partial [Symbiobacteriaceae bacterium]|nr:zinc-binding dehydrogenase [Symbiobacteriaceae bacterium]